MSVAVAISRVEKRFGSLRALAGVSLQIAEGEFFGLLGPNGAGKTTLISCLAGLVRPDAGQLTVMGHDVVSDYREARRRLGVVPQELVFDPFFSVRETLRIQSGYFGIRRNDDWIDEILANLDLTAKADTNMRRLSGGMKRRVLVAQALVHRPPVIVLDEPTAGVDVELRQGLWQFIRRLNQDGHTVILTTHYLEEAEALCARIAMLKAGRVVALDTTRNLLARFSGQTLNLRLAGPVQLPPVLRMRASESGGTWTFQLAGLDELEPLLAGLRVGGCVIEEMRLTQPDLEDVFLGVMQGSAGKDAAPC
ncbi:MAG: Daunorubicin/doxorubicin resistance ATP-binding protein DrrA [Candidatus Accumulibacter regalis]|jgi:ABC-2 type transport system ATP-binding protein|uniref:Daunorubicin/doxorubicin resistance ATP-binding protein DrrA n=1 Tax=Accumulibacter regalis TaxID=522306 RepID=A0A011R243_ACCRE|nr:MULTISPECIES: ABC transporter ATP-binding protein [unclassified Candidatus Accumulibacter]EXI85264.1 MAG: Daunorubicin/doxorubicin resistance ATP-binding protein DrrA [Candidatus Accumulibacter regalis]MQM33443.1 ABC transporter ATP-binding protein [Candidatus Accumulibacter phosphatis]MBL8366483.1 ABC transporter ATP-binding protein [Accumulibacter sp.]MBN8514050.1 ABC transporter ATP-binding protein [Accumulibacter sp.]MBO3702646.1 ABC transporter ATP-binding protein [Accumulibacter sp.]